MPNSCCIKSKVEWKVLMKRKCVPNKKKTILRKKETEPTTPSLSEINRNIQHAEECGGRREEGQSIPCRHQLLRDQRSNQACGWRGTNIQKLITRNCIFELNLRIAVGPMGAVVREREREREQNGLLRKSIKCKQQKIYWIMRLPRMLSAVLLSLRPASLMMENNKYPAEPREGAHATKVPTRRWVSCTQFKVLHFKVWSLTSVSCNIQRGY